MLLCVRIELFRVFDCVDVFFSPLLFFSFLGLQCTFESLAAFGRPPSSILVYQHFNLRVLPHIGGQRPAGGTIGHTRGKVYVFRLILFWFGIHYFDVIGHIINDTINVLWLSSGVEAYPMDI